MILGSLGRRPDKEAAYRQLKSHLATMGVAIAIIRVIPYVLHYVNKENELKLEF
ncbi:mitochondrial import receptor subunit TOM6 homolog [Aristolochia californica]|uniref:mitochondrial import receptor subunit TOM6 homolog n=1 Tax=Aristolochia californica TaxID=171875 RepID=UPI0035D73EDE